MLGLGQIQVEVLDRRDGKGYAELSSGHTSSGYEPSRMCSKCALYRVAILECTTAYPATHSVVPIPGVDESSFDVTMAFNSLFAAEDSGGDGGLCGPPHRDTSANPWCSICVNPTFYQRAGKPTEGSVIKSLVEMGLKIGMGAAAVVRDALPDSCGLLLCGPCASLMRQFKGRLGPTVEKRKKEGVEMRAVIEFLSTASVLYQTYVRKGCGLFIGSKGFTA
ncbi:hypothetical protein ACJ73_02850 [Blastomyces percursus]|uniref:Uncharacterized protein n=1 Tax=Blastomyces percursus TaxID=1658174 RepID=A0A1J9RCS0_9EURO|nr:hypothetical protein ACJ73_02850 [Blastomyces percursus]